MATSTRASASPESTAGGRRGYPVFGILIGLASLAVLLQGLWAGLFLEHDGQRNASQSWIDVHARGADVSILLAAAATVVAFVALRARRDLWLGSLAFTVLLVLESYLGGLIRDNGQDTLTAVHVPLAMAIMALAGWLPLRARFSAAAARTPARNS